jgi:EmrB/QacA subfamily drug resistance transporter
MSTLPPAPDQDSQEALRARVGPNLRWWMLISMMTGTMASVMASTIVNVAVPSMSREFVLTPSRAQWLSACFMAAMTLSMMTTPRLLQVWGYRRTYMGAVALLLLGGIGGGLSAWFGLVMVMRLAEGLAAGVLQPIPAIVIMRAFASHEQGKAMGIFGFGVLLAPAIGPSVGGVLVEWFGWRSTFFAVVPFCLVALPMAKRFLPVTAPGGVAAGEVTGRFDWLGLALLCLTLLSLLNGLVQLHDPQLGGSVALLSLSALSFGAFLYRQLHVATPLVSLGVFRQGALGAGSAVAFIYGMALFGSTYLLPVFMQTALHLPPSQAGAVLLPAGLMLALTNPVAGRMADRLPAHRQVCTGMLVIATSFAAMGWVSAATSLAVITAWAAMGRMGMGIVLPALNLGSLRGIDKQWVAQGASTINFMRQLGGAVGVSLVGVALEWRLDVHGVGGVPTGHAEPLAQLAAYHETFMLLATTMGLAMLAGWRVRSKAVQPA